MEAGVFMTLVLVASIILAVSLDAVLNRKPKPVGLRSEEVEQEVLRSFVSRVKQNIAGVLAGVVDVGENVQVEGSSKAGVVEEGRIFGEGWDLVFSIVAPVFEDGSACPHVFLTVTGNVGCYQVTGWSVWGDTRVFKVIYSSKQDSTIEGVVGSVERVPGFAS